MNTRTTTGTTVLSAEGEVIDFKNNQFEKYKVASIPLETCDGIVKFLDTLDLKKLIQHLIQESYKLAASTQHLV